MTEHEPVRLEELRYRRGPLAAIARGAQSSFELCFPHAARIITPCAIIRAVLAGMLRVLVVALVVLVAAIFIIPRSERGGALQHATLLPKARALPDVALVDTQKRPLHLGDLHGQYTLLYFGFTNCRDTCAFTLKTLADARAELARRAPRIVPPRVVFVSVDPRRDSAERMAAYLAQFDAAFIGATAPEHALEPLLGALGVRVERQTRDDGQYTIAHSDSVYVLSPDSELIAVADSALDAAIFAADYLKIRQRRPTA